MYGRRLDDLGILPDRHLLSARATVDDAAAPKAPLVRCGLTVLLAVERSVA